MDSSALSSMTCLSGPLDGVQTFIPLIDYEIKTDLDNNLILFNLCFFAYQREQHNTQILDMHTKYNLFCKNLHILPYLDQITLVRFVQKYGNADLSSVILKHIIMLNPNCALDTLIESSINNIILICYGHDSGIRDTYVYRSGETLWNLILRKKFPDINYETIPGDRIEEKLIIQTSRTNQYRIIDIIILILGNDTLSRNSALIRLMNICIDVNDYTICNKVMRESLFNITLLTNIIFMWKSKITDIICYNTLKSVIIYNLNYNIHAIHLLIQNINDITQFDFISLIIKACNCYFFDLAECFLRANQLIIDANTYQDLLNIASRPIHTFTTLLCEMKHDLLEGRGG